MSKRPDVSHIKDLIPDGQNRRRHTPRNLGMVTDSLHQVGAARSIVIDEDNVILAGNGVTEAAAEAGITRVRVVEADGQELIAVRRTGLSEAQKRALALFDNRTGELAEWNAEQLQADADAGLDLQPWFSDAEQARLFNQRDDPSVHWKGMPEVTQDDLGAFHSIQVHFKDAAALEAFGRLVGQPVSKTVRYLWVPEQTNVVFEDQRYT